jgi:hypothetical protein
MARRRKEIAKRFPRWRGWREAPGVDGKEETEDGREELFSFNF